MTNYCCEGVVFRGVQYVLDRAAIPIVNDRPWAQLGYSGIRELGVIGHQSANRRGHYTVSVLYSVHSLLSRLVLITLL